MKPVATAAFATLVMFFTAGAVRAELSANIGFMSEYIFRGVPQSDSAAMGGVDFQHEGFYIGTWAADVGMGAEVDGYLGYKRDFGDFNLGIGATGYFYTDDFDEQYTELNLYAGYRFITLEYTLGEYDVEPTEDYRYLGAQLEHGGFYGRFGTFGDDFDGNYVEFGYSTTVQGIDIGLALINSDDELAGDDDNTHLVMTISHSFAVAD